MKSRIFQRKLRFHHSPCSRLHRQAHQSNLPSPQARRTTNSYEKSRRRRETNALRNLQKKKNKADRRIQIPALRRRYLESHLDHKKRIAKESFSKDNLEILQLFSIFLSD